MVAYTNHYRRRYFYNGINTSLFPKGYSSSICSKVMVLYSSLVKDLL